MVYLSTASSFWFSLASSYDHEFHLSKQLGMAPQAFEYLLVAAQLAHFHKKWGFSMKKVNWKLFIDGHQFATANCMGMFEVDANTVDLNAFMNGMSAKQRVESHFIWIRVLAVDSPRKIKMQRYNDGRMIITPPQLNGLWLRQQSFRQCIEQYKWNYVLEEEEDNNKDDEDKDNKDEDNKEVNAESDVDGKHNTSSPTTSNKICKCNAITPPSDAKTYPHLL
jgi:hypothetical protein